MAAALRAGGLDEVEAICMYFHRLVVSVLVVMSGMREGGGRLPCLPKPVFGKSVALA